MNMAVTQMIEIDGKQVKFRASAAIPRIYRIKFNRDIYKDLAALEKAIGDGDENSSNLDLFSLEMFVRGKVNLPPHGKEFFHSTVSSFLHAPVSTFYSPR